MDRTEWVEGLREDHARVLRDVGALESALADPANRHRAADGMSQFVTLLERQFRTHMKAEDEVLYPAIARALPGSAASIEPLHDEHAELRQMLRRLQDTLQETPGPEREEQITIQVHDLADLLRLHIRKEEALVFQVAARVLAPEEIDVLLEHRHDTPRPHRTSGMNGPETLTKKGSPR